MLSSHSKYIYESIALKFKKTCVLGTVSFRHQPEIHSRKGSRTNKVTPATKKAPKMEPVLVSKSYAELDKNHTGPFVWNQGPIWNPGMGISAYSRGQRRRWRESGPRGTRTRTTQNSESKSGEKNEVAGIPQISEPVKEVQRE